MTKLEYCPDCSHIETITDNDIGNVPHMDVPAADRIHTVLADDGVLDGDETVDDWDPFLALVTMLAYDGDLAEYELAATPFDPVDAGACPECDAGRLVGRWLTVTVVDETQRQLLWTCPDCGFDPDRAGAWEYRVDEDGEWGDAHAFHCPECETVVWTDYYDVPGDAVETYTDEPGSGD